MRDMNVELGAHQRNGLVVLLVGRRHDLQAALTPYLWNRVKRRNSAFVPHLTVSLELRCFRVQSCRSLSQRGKGAHRMSDAIGSYIRSPPTIGRRARFPYKLVRSRLPILIRRPVR